jgi:hypothetical protein
VPRIKLEITRKPPPPPLPSFVCVICETEIERDSWNPNFQREPICFACTMDTPTRPKLAGSTVEQWSNFHRAHALLCAIDMEIARARRHH